MAIGRPGHVRGRLTIPHDRTTQAVMAFFIALVVFFAVVAIWGFGLSGGLRFF